jgi:hypothetical protein
MGTLKPPQSYCGAFGGRVVLPQILTYLGYAPVFGSPTASPKASSLRFGKVFPGGFYYER